MSAKIPTKLKEAKIRQLRSILKEIDFSKVSQERIVSDVREARETS